MSPVRGFFLNARQERVPADQVKKLRREGKVRFEVVNPQRRLAKGFRKTLEQNSGKRLSKAERKLLKKELARMAKEGVQ